MEGTGLDEVAVRRLIRELLMSRSANSSFWRFELQSALFNLNIGHVYDLVAPAQMRAKGMLLSSIIGKLALSGTSTFMWERV